MMFSQPKPRLLLLAGLCLAVAATGVQAATDRSYCAEDPYADPKTDICNPIRYIPTLWAAILALTLYALAGIAMTVQFIRYGGKYFLCLLIGAYCMAFGLAMRIPFRNDPHSRGVYIVQYLFVVLSPCAFLAADYILLGRLTSHLSGDHHLRPINPRKVTLLFVGSDITTFLIQAAGGGLSISDNRSTSHAGEKIFLAGILLQMASFVFFTGMWALFGWRCRKNDPTLWNQTWWKPLYWALGFTCICFLIRSVFRSVELSQGYVGFLATHEIYLYMLDTLPLFIGIIVYIYFWPAKILTPENRIGPNSVEDRIPTPIEGEGQEHLAMAEVTAGPGSAPLTASSSDVAVVEKEVVSVEKR